MQKDFGVMMKDQNTVSSDEGLITGEGWVFNIQRYSIQDGPGIRTTVFLKGCPLRCQWCDNPESQRLFPDLLYFDNLCVRCYRCIDVCPEHANKIASDGSVMVDYSKCKAYGKCVDVCLGEARSIQGRLMSVEEVVDVVKRDELFYRNSNGGVTLSGGEPTYQPEFAFELFKKCAEIGYHTTLDTCGYVRWEILERILDCVDLVLYDVKHMDPQRHHELTLVSNELILENACRVAGRGKEIIIRVPLIPGYNDSWENICALAEFMVEVGIKRIDILPYHRLGVKKYERLGLRYELDGLRGFKKEDLEGTIQLLESYGLTVLVV